jgi:hypothetical protein
MKRVLCLLLLLALAFFPAVAIGQTPVAPSAADATSQLTAAVKDLTAAVQTLTATIQGKDAPRPASKPAVPPIAAPTVIGDLAALTARVKVLEDQQAAFAAAMKAAVAPPSTPPAAPAKSP